MIENLKELINPLGVTEFEKKNYKKRPLLIKGDKTKFDSLFQYSDLNKILNNSTIPHPKLRIYKEGKLTIFRDFGSILNAFYEGSTIIIDQIHLYDQRLRKLVSNTSKELGEQTLLNLYLSPPGISAFHPHYDSHDVYIIQLEGKKSWKIYGKNGMGVKKPIIDCILSKGDLLYIPKGFWHSAIATDETSLHITLGAPVRTGIDFLMWLTNDLYNRELWSSGFPIKIQDISEPTGLVTSQIKDHINQLAIDLSSLIELNVLSEKYSEYINCTLEKNQHFNFPIPSKSDILNNDNCMLNLDTNIKIQLKSNDHTISIIFWDKILTFDENYLELINYILKLKHFSVSILSIYFKNKFSYSEITTIIGELVKEGLLISYITYP